MDIKEIHEKHIWDTFFNANGSPSFLHSWEWGEIQSSLGYKIKRIGVFEKNELTAIALLIIIKSKRGNFVFIPHGPVTKSEIPALPAGRRISKSETEIVKTILDYCKRVARENNCSFVRIAPVMEHSPENIHIFQSLGFKTAPIYMHAERVWALDITKDEETLLKEMRKTTRYSIRKAEKEGVTVVKINDGKAIDEFLNIYSETAERENFTPFSKNFLVNEYSSFQKTGNANWFFAYEKDGKLTAAALVDYTSSTAFYHQGATLHSKTPTSYVLQWESIKEAKKRGCRLYNFWGTYQPGRTPKNWSGLSLFKQGFGGFQVDYVPTQDYVLSPKYYLTLLYENILKLKRGV